VIDFHCHLDLYPKPHDVAAHCVSRGLYVLSVTTTPSAWHGTVALGAGAPRIKTALGLHPHLAKERQAELSLFDKLLPRTRYVGEVGLDGSPEFAAQWKAQLAVFTHILESCTTAGGRVLSIHSKRASAPVLDLLDEHKGVGIPVLHWFSGSRRDLERAVARGCWFSVGPAMLRGAKGRELVSLMPRDRVLTESDGPFAQIRNTTVMPWQVDEALANLAVLWAVSPVEAENLTHKNFRKLSSLVPA
jgi:TatD DNase family protein